MMQHLLSIGTTVAVQEAVEHGDGVVCSGEATRPLKQGQATEGTATFGGAVVSDGQRGRRRSGIPFAKRNGPAAGGSAPYGLPARAKTRARQLQSRYPDQIGASCRGYLRPETADTTAMAFAHC